MGHTRRFLIVLCGLSLLGASSGRAGEGVDATIAYRIEARNERADVRSRFTGPQVALLEKLNRTDAAGLNQLPVLVVPQAWNEDERAYSPLPAVYDAAVTYPKMLVVHLPGQVFGAYESGALVRWGPVSSGARSTPTPPGRYALTWKSPGHASSVNADWFLRWYFNFDNQQGLALHQYSLPGAPASHGCIRLLERDAVWLYGWGDGWTLDRDSGRHIASGTPVVVVGGYRYDEPPPWRSLEWLERHVALP